MNQPEELSETFVQKTNEFYQIIVELFGKKRAPDIVRKMFSGGRGLAEEIRTLGLETVYARAAVQAGILEKPARLGTRRSCVAIVVRIERLSELWHELYDFGHSRHQTVENMRRVLADRVPYPF